MGISHSFEDIEKRYGQKGVDYITAKYHERKIYERINDEIIRLNDHSNLQENQDIQFLQNLKRKLEDSLKTAKIEADAKKKGSIEEAEARRKQKVQEFSGYNEKKVWLENLQKQIKNKYATERVRMQERVREEVRKYQKGSSLNKIPEYDSYPDNYRRTVQYECIAKYPTTSREADATELQKKLTWENYKQNFITILNRDQVAKEVDDTCRNIRQNLVPGNVPICC